MKFSFDINSSWQIRKGTETGRLSIHDLIHRLANQYEFAKADLLLKCGSAESKIQLLTRQLEISQRNEMHCLSISFFYL